MMGGAGGRGRGGHGIAKLDPNKNHFRILLRSAKHLWPMHNWGLKLGFAFSMIFLVISKLTELGTPLAMKRAVDDLSKGEFPFVAVMMYGGFRFAAEFFGNLRDVCFASVSSQTERVVAIDLFRHLQSLSLEFHLHRETGSVLRSVSRGANSFGSLLRVVLFNIFPVLLQVAIISGYLFSGFKWYFGAIVIATVLVYFLYTFYTTEWRNHYRREMNACDNDFNQKSADALLNFETVKYFNAEQHEAERIDTALSKYAVANTATQRSRAVLNVGQSLIITTGVVSCMMLSAKQVADDWGSGSSDKLTSGDFVMIQAFILQLFAPLMALGMYYIQLRQAIVDVESLMDLLETRPDIVDDPDAQDFPCTGSDDEQPEDFPPEHLPAQPSEGLAAASAVATAIPGLLRWRRPASLEFRNVRFRYGSKPDAPWILNGISFVLPAGQKLAIVGSTGAGKSTIARLIYRFYEIQEGQILIDGVDIAGVRQHSLRSRIAIVPQDTVLFNDTLAYNIAYGRAGLAWDRRQQAKQRSHPRHPSPAKAPSASINDSSRHANSLEEGLLARDALQSSDYQPLQHGSGDQTLQKQPRKTNAQGRANGGQDEGVLLHGMDGDEDQRLRLEIEAAARTAQLHDMIVQQPEGYFTRVGERGLRLSGGEKQRTSLARALLKRPKLFIFDEATSALDSRTEAEIQLALDSASAGRTTITIAHRLSTIKNSDCILVLHKGRIVEQGRHQELLGLNGQYRKMWDVQQRIELHQQELRRMESISLSGYEDDLACGDGPGDVEVPAPDVDGILPPNPRLAEESMAPAASAAPSASVDGSGGGDPEERKVQ